MRTIVGAMLLAALWALPGGAIAQSRGNARDDGGEQAFVETLRRQDPVTADRYVALRDARQEAAAELQRMENQYRAAGVELRGVFLGQLKQAQRKYAASSLAFLDFLDERNRRAVASYQEEIDKINALLEDHQRARAELGKLLQPD
jgi:hypothetical protein